MQTSNGLMGTKESCSDRRGLSMQSAPVQKIYRFGTSGYRNDQDSEFNETVICQITGAISDCLIEEIEQTGKLLPVLLGGDTREKTRRFLPLIAQLLRERGLEVFQASTDLPSPVLAYAAKYFGELNLGYPNTLGAILMTASHNPWPYGGFNFLTPDAAVMPTHVSKKFEEAQSYINQAKQGGRDAYALELSLKLCQARQKEAVKVRR